MRRLMLPVAAMILIGAAGGRVVRYPLPQEETVLPAGRGAETVQAACAACHSLDYVTTQPRGKGAKFWGDEVTKMIEKYGATVADGDRGAIVEYLARHF